jgi:hypothetical protein
MITSKKKEIDSSMYLKIIFKRLGFMLVLAAAVTVLQLHHAAAASPAGPGNGLRVSPVRTDVTVQPGHSQTVNITVTNVTGGTASFQAVINDFVAAADESGNPSIILDPTKFAPSHSLKRFIGPVAIVTLQPGEEKTVPIVITVPANAAGGGYYGAVRFAPANTSNAPGKQISLSGSVGSLILAKVPGNIKEQLSIAGVDVYSGKRNGNFFTSNKGLNVYLRFQNEGNIQEAPFGKVIVKNRSNKTIGTYEINNINPPGNVLPDSIRRFTLPIKTGNFGEYKIEGNFGYGSAGQLLSVATTIYIIPISLIVGFIVIVALLGLAIFGIPRLLKAYNRQVLRRAGRR